MPYNLQVQRRGPGLPGPRSIAASNYLGLATPQFKPSHIPLHVSLSTADN
jgi:hypothetical protein